MRKKMTSKEALQNLSHIPIFDDDDSNIIANVYCCAYIGDLCEVYDSEVNIIKKDLDRLEKLEKENQELKEQVNHFKKVIEAMKNPSKLDCTHMFDNCKKITPLPKMEALEIIRTKNVDTDLIKKCYGELAYALYNWFSSM